MAFPRAMWLLMVNGLVYITFGFVTGDSKKAFFWPISAGGVLEDHQSRLDRQLSHMSHELHQVQNCSTPESYRRDRYRAIGPVDVEARFQFLSHRTVVDTTSQRYTSTSPQWR